MGRGDWPRELDYLGEIRWLASRGLIKDYWQYLALPYAVIADCRLVMRAELEMKNDGAQPTQNLLADEGVD